MITFDDVKKWTLIEGTTLFFGFVVAASAVVATFIYFGQYCQSVKTSNAQRSIDRPILRPADVEHLGRRNDRSFIYAEIKNLGNTPAHDVKFWWIWQTDEPRSMPLDTTTWQFMQGSGSLPREAGFADLFKLSQDDRKRINNAGQAFVLGKITYKDYFPQSQNITHLVRFCSKISGPNGEVESFGWDQIEGCRGAILDCTDDDQACRKEFADLNHEK